MYKYQPYFSSLFQITLASSHNNRYIIITPDPVNQVLMCHDLIETPPICDGVTQYKPLPIAHILLSHCRKFQLK